MNINQAIVNALSDVWQDSSAPLHQPHFIGNEKAYLNQCIDTTFVSSVGRFVDDFEKFLAEFIGCAKVVCTSSGTSALEISLRLSGVEQNDEVIVSPLTFVATANAVSYLSAYPHFADCDQISFGLDPLSLRDWLRYTSYTSEGVCINKYTSRRIKAILPTHVFGLACNLEGLVEVANEFNLTLIEDSAESLGTYYQGVHTGHFGSFGAFSFNGNKIITTGGGGAIATNNIELAKLAKHITTTAKLPHPWSYWHDQIGYNYRMPNINAALGLAQLENISKILAAKRSLHSAYQDAFANPIFTDKLQLVHESHDSCSNYWLQTLILDTSLASCRDSILDHCNNYGYSMRPVWSLLHKLPMYINNPRSPLPNAEKLEMCLLNIPSNPSPSMFNLS